MQSRYDLVVVGAGPAGSTAARYAVAEGLSVLLLDKKKTIGVPVCCGEFLPAPSVAARAFPNAPGTDELFPVDPAAIRRKIRRLVVVSPKGREYPIPLPGCTIDRDTLDQSLAAAAVREGATLATETKFLALDGHTVTTSRGSVRAGVVIAADGPLSRVCRFAGLSRSTVLAPAVTCRVEADLGDDLRIFFGKRHAPGGYAWIFPKDGSANVGLGLQKSGVPVKRLLESFLESHGLDPADPIRGCYVPVAGPLPATVRGPVLAAGDAAGHVVASNGGGIGPAMICGRLAGLAAAAHLLRGEPLEAYEQAWRQAIGNELQAALRTKRMADAAFRSDFLMEQVMRALGEWGIERVLVYNGTGLFR
ncbi:NAD(P)/FAD-dependent oxidoreductase [Methanoculleus sp. FWC-SCC1]|uniref:NAD(P)/FAD-dependent oxidoreductase n=1 Tax=Methanoculleus frigidifontis TaxID=2584085 RepID=A0ABT8MDF9_9EURY|nr:NAD(P)/FAD-dependent oxidoreductase [Methanoculleus sp. FWC-SCC1]MDN7025961.1 NAD(P)/FAD-dependent oxidoreductase [Methanoculleus sp. FWC-SCC1]